MPAHANFKIDLKESFEHLPNAPIVEAVIHWRARSEKKLVPAELLRQLKERLPDYPMSQQQQEIEMASQVGEDGSAAQQHRTSWHGFRFESNDHRHVAQFTRNGFVFSRLKPYESWEPFEAEAQRLWQVYRELAEPSEIQRLGVRFINLIAPVQPEQLKRLLTLPPKNPKGLELPVRGFMHQTTFEIPGSPYTLNVNQTIQPTSPPHASGFNLILDIDVSTTTVLELDSDKIKQRLAEMRWLKDKAFFTLLKKSALKRFKEVSK